jgi:demethylmenaquinone methyltransferase / 2-methoxy-6-polyprenyl-1,4-benzoquinol methylase
MKHLKKIFENKPKAEYVHDIFENLAVDYDLMNYIMSFGMHKFVKKQAIKNVPIQSNAKVLDVCCGTGDISIFIAKTFGDSVKITGVDFSEKMLKIAAKKAKKYKNIEFITGDALNLAFEDNSFDAVFISFGLRNLADLKKGIIELQRVTKKGGYVVNLDFGKPKSIKGQLFGLYFSRIVPLIGKLIHGNSVPYKYLTKSFEDFPSQEELVKIFYELGFEEAKNYNFAFGAIAQQVARV